MTSVTTGNHERDDEEENDSEQGGANDTPPPDASEETEASEGADSRSRVDSDANSAERVREGTERPPRQSHEVSDTRHRPRDDDVELDYSPSSGAVDPEHAAQDQSTGIKVGRFAYTENATSIGGRVPAKARRWETLNETNREFYADEETDIKQAQRRQDTLDDTKAWGRRIGLTDYEIRHAVHLVDTVGPDAWEARGSATIALAALTIAANEDETSHTRKIIRASARAIAEDDRNDLPVLAECIETYETIRADLGVSEGEVRAARQHIKKTT